MTDQPTLTAKDNSVEKTESESENYVKIDKKYKITLPQSGTKICKLPEEQKNKDNESKVIKVLNSKTNKQW